MGTEKRVKVGVATALVGLGAAAVLALALPMGSAEARGGIGRRTGQQCGVCHVDPEGGGDLTEKGQAFAITFEALADIEAAWAKVEAAEAAGTATPGTEAAALPAADAAPLAVEDAAGGEGAALAGG